MNNDIVAKEHFHSLKGERVVLAPITAGDIDFLCDEESDEELWKYEERVETDRAALTAMFADRITDANRYDYIARRISDGSNMGLVNLWKCDASRRSWELGYGFLPQYQGHGYGLESVRRLLAFAFDELNAHKVLGMCNCENVKSAAIMRKAGMSMQGVFREEYLCHGKWVDQYYFSILEREYRAALR